jgi:ketosteroid isomerase-like protein
MSQENIQLARQYVEVFNAEGLDGTQHLRHPEIEVHDPPDFPDADRYFGEAAVRNLVESYKKLGWDGQFHCAEYLDAGQEVVVLWQVAGRAALGGVPIEVPAFGHVYAFEDGKVRRIRQYLTRTEALKAAGLRE